MNLELTAEQANILEQALASYISDLRVEVAGTESKDLRDELKVREQELIAVQHKLQSSLTPAGSWPYEPPPDVDAEGG